MHGRTLPSQLLPVSSCTSHFHANRVAESRWNFMKYSTHFEFKFHALSAAKSYFFQIFPSKGDKLLFDCFVYIRNYRNDMNKWWNMLYESVIVRTNIHLSVYRCLSVCESSAPSLAKRTGISTVSGFDPIQIPLKLWIQQSKMAERGTRSMFKVLNYIWLIGRGLGLGLTDWLYASLTVWLTSEQTIAQITPSFSNIFWWLLNETCVKSLERSHYKQT